MRGMMWRTFGDAAVARQVMAVARQVMEYH